MNEDDDLEYGSITQLEHEALLSEIETATVERCREIIKKLLKIVPVYGYSKYDPDFGCDRVCECDHPYHRHFDSYEDMAPVGCKYCRCHAFVEKGTDLEKWKRLNPDCDVL